MFSDSDEVEIWVCAEPGTERRDPKAPPMDCIEVLSEYLHVESWGLRITGCWVSHEAGDESKPEFSMGTVLIPWHRVLTAEAYSFSSGDWERGWDDKTRELLVKWAEEHGLDAKKLMEQQEMHARFR